MVLQSGRGDKARVISESLVVKSMFPSQTELSEYRIGIGDTLTISKLIQNNRSNFKNQNQWPENNDNTIIF